MKRSTARTAYALLIAGLMSAGAVYAQDNSADIADMYAKGEACSDIQPSTNESTNCSVVCGSNARVVEFSIYVEPDALAETKQQCDDAYVAAGLTLDDEDGAEE